MFVQCTDELECGARLVWGVVKCPHLNFTGREGKGGGERAESGHLPARARLKFHENSLPMPKGSPSARMAVDASAAETPMKDAGMRGTQGGGRK